MWSSILEDSTLTEKGEDVDKDRESEISQFEAWELNARRNGIISLPIIAVAQLVRWVRSFLKGG